jgi:hypothetical protein
MIIGMDTETVEPHTWVIPAGTSRRTLIDGNQQLPQD